MAFSIKSKLKQVSLLTPSILLLGIILFVSALNQSENQIEHLANYQKDEFYKEFTSPYKQDKNQKIDVKGIIVPHHLFARSLIERLFIVVKNNEVDQIILLSPNHFDQGHGLVITSNAVWQTNFGKVYPAKNSIKKLTEDDIVAIEEDPFKKEHGIYNILPFIKISFPKAKVIPIILKSRTNQAISSKLAEKLTQITTKNTLIVASLDFSHFQTPLVAQEHDKKSIKIIRNFDFDNIYALDLDSPSALYAFLKYLKLMDCDKFTLLENTNSGFLSNNPNLKETTSYITGYFQ